MSCCEAQEIEIGAYLDGALDTNACAVLESHLATCAPCTNHLRAERELDGALRALPRIAPSAQFEARFFARLARELDPPETFWSRLWTRRFALAAGSAAVLTLLLTGGGGGALPSEDWSLITDEDSFELMLSEDHELVYELDVLESFDETEEI